MAPQGPILAPVLEHVKRRRDELLALAEHASQPGTGAAYYRGYTEINTIYRLLGGSDD